MKKNESAKHSSRPQLRLIHGGTQSTNTNVRDTWRSAPEVQTPLAADAERLRHAILCTVVEEVGRTVDEVLRELNEKLDSEKLEDFMRYSELNDMLGLRGLLYLVAPPHLELDCNGYLTLSNVKRLITHHPELSSLRPEEHQLLTLGELPPYFRRTSWPAKQGSVPFLSQKPRQEHGDLTAVGARYFDAGEGSVWGEESNRLRRAILALQLEDVGCSVQQALDELCSLDAPETEDEHYREAVLCYALESIGLRYGRDATLPVPGYLSLSWPNRLLRCYPQLAALHPLTWHMLQIA